MRKKYLNISRFLFYIGFFLISFIFFNLLVSTLLFIFKISINKCNIFIAGLLSIVLNLYLNKKNKENKILILSSILISILLIIIPIYLSGRVYDYSYDGNSYHKVTIGEMMDGWNPLYEKMEDFDSNRSDGLGVTFDVSIWSNHYAKASHIFAANVGVVTRNVESGKCINTISILAVFLLLASFIIYERKKIFFAILFGICVVTCTVISTQFLTNYVDGLVYLYFFLLIFSFFMLEKYSLFSNKNIILLLYFMILVIAINIKFSLFAFAGIYCLGYYIWYLIRLKMGSINKTYFIKFTLVSIISVLIAVFVVGLSVYPKNLIQKGNPFYPLMGKDKVDIMTANQPDYFKEKSTIEKFYIATFSEVENINEAAMKEATFKKPFTINSDELKRLKYCDLRISGNGVLFSGILIISFVLLIVELVKIFKKDKALFCLCIIPLSITLLMIFLLSESWWARYFPQLHLIVLFALLLLDLDNNKVFNNIMYMLIAIIFINNYLSFDKSIEYSIDFTKEVNQQYYIFENDNKECKLTLYTTLFYGAFYNVTERESNYEIIYVSDIDGVYNMHDYYMKGFVYWSCE